MRREKKTMGKQHQHWMFHVTVYYVMVSALISFTGLNVVYDRWLQNFFAKIDFSY